MIIINLFYKAPFKALEVAEQHIKNSSKDTVKKAEELKSRATERGTSQAQACLKR